VGLRGLNIDNKENEEEDNYTTTVEDFQNQYNKVLHNSANFTIKSKQLYNPQLGPYLAGLIEGDGHIYVPTEFRAKNGKIRYCFIRIVFDIRDLPLAVHDLSLIKDKSWTFTKIKDFWGSLFTVKIRRSHTEL
jgi:hypothetical protein